MKIHSVRESFHVFYLFKEINVILEIGDIGGFHLVFVVGTGI